MHILSRLTVFFLVPVLLLQSCYSVKEYQYTSEDFISYKDKAIISVTMKNGDLLTFDQSGGRYAYDFLDSTARHKIVGFDPVGRPVSISLDRALEVHCESVSGNAAGTVLGIALGSVALAFVILIAALSGGGWH